MLGGANPSSQPRFTTPLEGTATTPSPTLPKSLAVASASATDEEFSGFRVRPVSDEGSLAAHVGFGKMSEVVSLVSILCQVQCS